MLRGKGDLESAEALFREALAGRRRLLGGAHPDTRAPAAYLAALLEKRGERAEAAVLRADAKC